MVHHKGRKKTTDTETGTAVGSVSLVAMQEKMAKKKPKEIDMNFYRFQKREAHLSGMLFHDKIILILNYPQWLWHMIEPRLCSSHFMNCVMLCDSLAHDEIICSIILANCQLSIICSDFGKIFGSIRRLPFCIFSLVRMTSQHSFCLLAWTFQLNHMREK